jgi:hypothetical protein
VIGVIGIEAFLCPETQTIQPSRLRRRSVPFDRRARLQDSDEQGCKIRLKVLVPDLFHILRFFGADDRVPIGITRGNRNCAAAVGMFRRQSLPRRSVIPGAIDIPPGAITPYIPSRPTKAPE